MLAPWSRNLRDRRPHSISDRQRRPYRQIFSPIEIPPRCLDRDSPTYVAGLKIRRRNCSADFAVTEETPAVSFSSTSATQPAPDDREYTPPTHPYEPYLHRKCALENEMLEPGLRKEQGLEANMACSGTTRSPTRSALSGPPVASTGTFTSRRGVLPPSAVTAASSSLVYVSPKFKSLQGMEEGMGN